MSKRTILLSFAVLASFCAGCTTWEDAPSSSPPTAATSESSADSSEATEAIIPGNILSDCEAIINTYFWDMSLYRTWEGAPVPAADPPQATSYELDVQKDGDLITVTVDLYGNLYLDPFTLEESTWDYGGVLIAEPDVIFATSLVRFRETTDGLTPVSCEYTPLDHPGLDYLKEQTEKLEPELAASERLDVSKYDAGLVNYVWRLAYSKRYIEKPEDLTLYDLANVTGLLELHHGNIGADSEDPDVRLDASLLMLLPNVDSLWCYYLLDDYSVFENMNGLTNLCLQWPGDKLFATLRVGHTDRLWLDDPDTDLLDLTGINADALYLGSWSTAVRGFAGCGNIQKLYFHATRTDMRLVNAKTFPGARYLNLYFYSDTPRVRDLSQLASFQDVKIDLILDYQACNNPTLESLAGVSLNDVYLNPKNGSYPLTDLDDTLLHGLDAKRLTIDVPTTMEFSERTGEEPITSEDRPPVFREGPGGAVYEARVGEERGGWTLESLERFDPADPTFDIEAIFSGEATLRGSISIHSEESEEGGPYLSGIATFTVAEESAHLMPYYQYDTREIWFEITNGDMIREYTGVDSGEFADCEITISGYRYIFAPMSVWNSGSVTEIHRIQ